MGLCPRRVPTGLCGVSASIGSPHLIGRFFKVVTCFASRMVLNVFLSIWKFEVLFRKVISYFEGNQTTLTALTWMIKFAEFKTALKLFKNLTFSQFHASEKLTIYFSKV